MKKIIAILIGITCCVLRSLGQPSFEFAKVKDCESAIKQADADANSGIFYSITYGYTIPDPRTTEFERFRYLYMASKYKIEYIDHGCVIQQELPCYAKRMKENITQNFGFDFLEKLTQEVKDEFEKFKEMDLESKLSFINNNHFYTRPETSAKYIAGEKEFDKELKKRISLETVIDVVTLHMFIDESGDIVKCKAKCALSSPSVVKKIQEEVVKMKGWKPATFYGQNVKSEIIVFSFF